MSKQLKLRRGTTAQHSTFTGAEGEVTVDTTKDTLVVHDGVTAGGVPLATEAALNAKQAADAELTTLAGMSSSRATYLASTQGFGFRNRIINGDMRIDERNNGASVTPTTNYTYNTCDRWIQFLAVSSRYSVQRNAGAVTPPTGFTNYLGATSLAATSLGATDIYALSQQIEGFNIADLGWGTASAQAVTISFWVRSSLTGTLGGALNNSGGSRSYPFSYTISAANTWEQKTLTVPGDTTGTWLTNNGIGLFLLFSLGSGTTRSGTAGSWSGSYFTSATGATSVVGTSGATFYITGVQLEAGTVASPFERRDYGRELMMCQRYYRTGGNLYGCVYATNNMISYHFQTTMRTVPTTTVSLAAASLPLLNTFATPDLVQFYTTGTVGQANSMTASAEL